MKKIGGWIRACVVSVRDLFSNHGKLASKPTKTGKDAVACSEKDTKWSNGYPLNPKYFKFD